MVQRVGAQYALKKFSDYVMAPPPADPEPQEPPASQSAPTPAVAAAMDGQTINDENGQPLGVARHVGNVAVYLITDQRRGLGEQLEQAIGDPDLRVFFHHDDRGQLDGLIYVPDPAKRPARPDATRADDI